MVKLAFVFMQSIIFFKFFFKLITMKLRGDTKDEGSAGKLWCNFCIGHENS